MYGTIHKNSVSFLSQKKGDVSMPNEKIKKLRKEKGISQSELAKQLFVSRYTITRWENGNSLPSTDNIQQLANFFEKDATFFMPNHTEKDIVDNNKLGISQLSLVIFIRKYWKDLCVFALALSPLLFLWFTPLSTLSFIYAKKRQKKYAVIVGLIVLTFTLYFLIEFIIVLIELFGIGGTTTEIIME